MLKMKYSSTINITCLKMNHSLKTVNITNLKMSGSSTVNINSLKMNHSSSQYHHAQNEIFLNKQSISPASKWTTP